MDKPLPVELVEPTKVRIDGGRSIFYEDADEVTPLKVLPAMVDAVRPLFELTRQTKS